jgi:2-dehydro-3-deoxyphosphogluconate aldolase/(4S)-4-hydroxy-2-oxoglutarate aldolase
MSAIERIRSERLVAILRRVANVDDAIARLRAAGIGVVEITLDSDDALDAIRRHPGALAGTVRTQKQVDAAFEAGAGAVVSPAFSPAVVARAAELGIPAIPGALTPTEVEAAWRAGAAMVKLFPGALGGPGYVRDLLAPLSDVPLLVTGGVDASNARAFLDAGAVAVGVGSALDDPEEARRLVEVTRLPAQPEPSWMSEA